MDDVGYAIELRGPSEASVVLALSGEFDLASERTLAVRLQECVDAGFEVGVDMAAVTFLESVAVAAIVRADNDARARGQRVRIVAASPRARRVLAMSGLTERLGLSDAH
jgi:anti-sigma B factor antagonist